MTRYLMILSMALSIGLSGANLFAANESPQTFTLDGQLFHVGSSNPLIDGGAKLTVQILDPSETCVLYEETQNVNTSTTEGFFNIQVGSLPGDAKRTGLDMNQSMQNVIQNMAAIPASNAPGKSCAGLSYSPAPGDLRYFRITVTPSSGGADTLTPDMVLDSVPSAIVAQSVQGLDRSSILHTNTSAGEVLTQTNLESLFTTAAFANLAPVLAGKYVQSGAGGASLPSFATAPTSPPAGDIWYDSTGKQLVYSDGTSTHTLGTSGAGVSSLTVGSNLTANGVAGGTLNAAGSIDLNTLGTAGTYPKVTTDAYGRVTSGAALVEADIPTLLTPGKVSGAAINAGTIGGAAAINTTGNIQTTNDITTKRFYLYDHAGAGPNYVGFQTVANIAATGASYTMTFPNSVGGVGNVLTTDGTAGNLSWAAPVDSSKVLKAGDTMTGLLVLSADPTAALGAATKQYVDTAVTGAGIYIKKDGTVPFTGDQSLGTHKLTNVLDPVAAQDAATKNYADTTFLKLAGGTMTGAITFPAGVATAGGAPFYLKSGPVLTTKVDGAVEYDGTNLFYTDSTLARRTIATTTGLGSYVLKAGDTMTGPLVNNSNSASTAVAVTQAGSGYAATFMGGNVGIGTTSPGKTLDVAGVVRAKTTSGQPALMATGASGSFPGVYISLNTDSVSRVGFELNASDQGSIFFSTGSSSQDVALSRGGSAKLLIGNGTPGDSSGTLIAGNVGIGATSPASALDINGAQTMREIASASAPTAAAGKDFIYADSTSHTLKVSLNGAAYVDLATGSAGGSYVLKGGDTMTGLLVLSGDPSAVLGAATKQYVDSAVSTSGGSYVLKAGDTMTGPLVNNTSSASTALKITQAGSGYAASFMGGNVGIATTSPANALDVNGAVAIGSYAGSSVNGNSLVVSGNTGIGTNVTSPYKLHLQSGTDARVMLAEGSPAGNSPLLFMMYNGFGAGNWANKISLQGGGSEKYSFGNDYAATGNQNFFIYDNVNTTYPFFIGATGNVGIATTAPFTALDVNGATTMRGIASDPSVSGIPATSGIVYYNTSGVMKFYDQVGAVWRSLVSADATQTLTNKTIDAEATGNTITIPFYISYKAGVCQDSTASIGFSMPTAANSPSAVCVTGTNTNYGVAEFTATGQSVQDHFTLPADWSGNIDLDGVYRSVDANTGHNAVWAIQTICVADGVTGDPAFNTKNSITDALKGTTLMFNTFSTTSITTTGCAAGAELFWKLTLDAATTATGNVDLISLRFKLRRAM